MSIDSNLRTLNRDGYRAPKDFNHIRRTVLGVVVIGLALSTNGCVSERLTEAREYAVDQLSLEYESIGDQLIAQISPAEQAKEPRFDGRGGGTSLHPFDRNGWPRGTVWGASLIIEPEGPRTPVEIKDDLESWLLSQGWGKPEWKSNRPAGELVEQVLTRGDSFSLRVQATTSLPPQPWPQRVELSVSGTYVD